MKNISIILLLFTTLLKAQTPLITIKSESIASDRSVSLYVESNSYATYTVRLNFPVLTGYSSTVSDGSLIQVMRGRAPIAKLTPSSTMSNSFNYRYTYYLGKAFSRKPDSNFVYLLPYTNGKEAAVQSVMSISESLKLKTEEHIHSTGFRFKLNDTICASRAGTIFDVLDTVSNGEKTTQRFSQHRNRIRIEQKDGTLASYTILAPIKALVTVGDNVIPGQPIAVFDKESDKYGLLFSVEYLDEKKCIEANNSGDKTIHIYNTLPIRWLIDTEKADFITQPQLLQAKYSPKIIGAELSKKEKKKLGID